MLQDSLERQMFESAQSHGGGGGGGGEMGEHLWKEEGNGL